MDKEINQEKLLNYVNALEAVNKQLLTALKRCLEVLAQVEPPAPDQKAWQEMLDDIETIIRSTEKVYTGETVH